MFTCIFDFDGTLVDSMPQWAKSMTAILKDCGITPPPDLIRIITPLGCIGTADYYIEHFGVKKTKDEILAKMAEYAVEEYTYRIPAKPYVPEKLRELKEAGCSLNVLTASPHLTLDPCLKRVGIYDLFDHVWSCDDFGTTKSDPHLYEIVASLLEKSLDECLFFDDNINSLRTAKSAGMRVVGVYDASSEDDTEAIRSMTELYLPDFSLLTVGALMFPEDRR